MNSQETDRARVIPLRPRVAPPAVREPLWRDVVGDVLRRERLAQERTLKDVADMAMISMPYLSELERGRKEASSEVLAAAARSLGLGLADLLALAQDELARLAQVRRAKMRAAADGRMEAVHGSVHSGSVHSGSIQSGSIRTAGSAQNSLPRSGLCLAA